MSDSHDHYDNLEKAIHIANERNCEYLLFAGDLIAPKNGLDMIAKFNGKVIMILGNNEAELIGQTRLTDIYENITLSKTSLGGNIYEGELDGISILMHHYPRIAELAFATNQYDMCICGHTHSYRHERSDKSQLINPGAIHPYGTSPTFAILDTSSKKIEKIDI